MKIADSESYEEVIWDLLEDHMELSAQTLQSIEEAKKQIATGKTFSHEQVKKRLGL